MQFIAAINCDAAAFEDNPAAEVAQVLRKLIANDKNFANRNLAAADPKDRTEYNPFLLFDANGNICGRAMFEDVDQ